MTTTHQLSKVTSGKSIHDCCSWRKKVVLEFVDGINISFLRWSRDSPKIGHHLPMVFPTSSLVTPMRNFQVDTCDVALMISKNTTPWLERMEVNHLAQVEFHMG